MIKLLEKQFIVWLGVFIVNLIGRSILFSSFSDLRDYANMKDINNLNLGGVGICIDVD